jgi:hypothetical protein
MSLIPFCTRAYTQRQSLLYLSSKREEEEENKNPKK